MSNIIKILKNNYKKILLWLTITLYFVIVPFIIKNTVKQTRVGKINIVILDSARHNFINKEYVKELLDKNKISLLGSLMDSVNTLQCEHIIESESVVKNAEVYTTYDGSVHIEITQRTPIVRIITYDKNTYYIDEDGYLMPYTSMSITRVPVATGKIDAPLELFDIKKFNVKNSDMLFMRDTLLKKIYILASYIHYNSFWNSNIEQIYVKSLNEFELIPKVGNFLINFGEVKNVEKKFRYLTVFYKDVLPKVGWNKYKEISLKFNNQIVCRK